MTLFQTNTGADFSPCRRYRYRLWRNWDPAAGVVAWIGLNPSTADEVKNDPTVERCQRRTDAMGHGGMVMLNLFGFRATDPIVMKLEADPIGPGNDAAILEVCQSASLVVCCWGNHGSHLERSAAVLAMLRAQKVPLHCLALNGSGEPKHPLYVGYGCEPVVWGRE
jgi:hypothetical protein